MSMKVVSTLIAFCLVANGVGTLVANPIMAPESPPGNNVIRADATVVIETDAQLAVNEYAVVIRIPRYYLRRLNENSAAAIDQRLPTVLTIAAGIGFSLAALFCLWALRNRLANPTTSGVLILCAALIGASVTIAQTESSSVDAPQQSLLRMPYGSDRHFIGRLEVCDDDGPITIRLPASPEPRFEDF